MKKIYKTILVVLASTTFLISCGGDDDAAPVAQNPNVPAGGSYIKGKVDGVQFQNLEVMGVSSAIATRTGTGDGTLIMMQGSTMDATSMVITTYGITSTGTYTIDAEDDGNVLAFIPGGSEVSYDTSNCAGAAGTLNITHLDNTKIEGTFEFTGKDDENCGDTKVVTEGSFRGIFMQ